MALNVSIFALPAYWLLVISTRMYTKVHLARNTIRPPSAASTPNSTSAPNHSPSTNVNPHSTLTYAAIQKSLSPSGFARWERIQAAHRNGNENMALYFASVILGNYAGLNALELNLCSWLFVAVRLLYVVVYVVVDSEGASYLRSASFGAGLFLNMWLILRAGVFVLRGYQQIH